MSLASDFHSPSRCLSGRKDAKKKREIERERGKKINNRDVQSRLARRRVKRVKLLVLELNTRARVKNGRAGTRRGGKERRSSPAGRFAADGLIPGSRYRRACNRRDARGGEREIISVSPEEGDAAMLSFAKRSSFRLGESFVFNYVREYRRRRSRVIRSGTTSICTNAESNPRRGGYESRGARESRDARPSANGDVSSPSIPRSNRTSPFLPSAFPSL